MSRVGSGHRRRRSIDNPVFKSKAALDKLKVGLESALSSLTVTEVEVDGLVHLYPLFGDSVVLPKPVLRRIVTSPASADVGMHLLRRSSTSPILDVGLLDSSPAPTASDSIEPIPPPSSPSHTTDVPRAVTIRLTAIDHFRLCVRRVIRGLALYKQLVSGTLQMIPFLNSYSRVFFLNLAEEKFALAHVVDCQGRCRTTLVALFWFNVLFALQDYASSAGSQLTALLITRLATIAPALALAWLTIRFFWGRPFICQCLLAFLMLLAGAGHSYHLYLLPEGLRESAFTNVLKICFLLPTSLGLQFRFTVLPSALLIFCLPISAWYLQQTDPGITYYMPHLVVLFCVANYTAWQLEGEAKSRFFFADIHRPLFFQANGTPNVDALP